ncbi:MAG TPA: hypothetical protein VMA32_16260 [Streptosporangiaceae bacterium]|nr:hypothetical protein [Streptosporangiaceae bacterium]
MTVSTSQLAECVSAYAARLHAVIGTKHHVASPLGAWLILALAAPASTGADRDTLTEVLGCDAEDAARAAADLLTEPHPLVASAAAVWTSPAVRLPETFQRWREALPGVVTTGDLPGQAELDAWAREHTFGLIDRFPISTDKVYLLLATALATKVSWQVPFDLAPVASLGTASPWANTLGRVLRTPARPGGHVKLVATTPQAGDVIVHIAAAEGGLEVVSVAAAPDVPSARVLAAAYGLGCTHAAGGQIEARDLASLPLGEHDLWSVREVSAAADSIAAVMPAWSANSDHDLSAPGLGFGAASHALVQNDDPWRARQVAMARYSRIGFEAAAVSALAVTSAMRLPARRREVVLQFGHPFAVVALATAPRGASGGGPWQGLPVFSAWVSEPEDATYDSSNGPAREPR